MSWEILFLIAVCLLVVLLVVFRKNPYVKKYWKFALILIPGVILIILQMIIKRKKPDGTNVVTPTQSSVTEIREALHEVNVEAAANVAAAKSKSAETIRELEEIKRIPERKERIKRYTAMIG